LDVFTSGVFISAGIGGFRTEEAEKTCLPAQRLVGIDAKARIHRYDMDGGSSPSR
jgi:hypothetical protein